MSDDAGVPKSLTAMDTRAIDMARQLSPSSLARHWVVQWGGAAGTLFGVHAWGEGGFAWLSDVFSFDVLGVLGLSALIGAVPVIANAWGVRRALKSTDQESVQELRTRLRVISDDKWPLRMAGVSAGVAGFMGGGMTVLLTVVDPSELVGGSPAATFLVLFALMFAMVLPVLLGFRELAVHELTAVVEPAPDAERD